MHESLWPLSFPPSTLGELAAKHGGDLRGLSADGANRICRLAPIEHAERGELAPLLRARLVREAHAAVARGATLLIDAKLAARSQAAPLAGWIHPHAAWAMARVLEGCDVTTTNEPLGEGCVLGQNVTIEARVRVGKRVRIGHGTILGRAGFGWATGPDGVVRAVPQLGGVVIEDDAVIGPLCTIDAGTLGPTRIGRGVKIDAHVHVGHNCEIGDESILAAQCGLAGSVIVGRGVMFGGQVGVADHVTIGDGARIAAKSGVIGDVPAGAIVAGYPAVARIRWLRGLAALYRGRMAAREPE